MSTSMSEKDREENVEEHAERDTRREITDGLWAIIRTRADAMGNELALKPPTKEQIRTAFLALMVETVELLCELDWKPWKRRRVEGDGEKIADEFADILAFLAIIMCYLMRGSQVTPYDLAGAYQRKMKVVEERMKGNVDGYEAQDPGALDA